MVGGRSQKNDPHIRESQISSLVLLGEAEFLGRELIYALLDFKHQMNEIRV